MGGTPAPCEAVHFFPGCDLGSALLEFCPRTQDHPRPKSRPHDLPTLPNGPDAYSPANSLSLYFSLGPQGDLLVSNCPSEKDDPVP